MNVILTVIIKQLSLIINFLLNFKFAELIMKIADH